MYDLGYFKRVDRADGWSDLVDGFGSVAATVRTSEIDKHCNNFDVRRFRLTKTAPAA